MKNKFLLCYFVLAQLGTHSCHLDEKFGTNGNQIKKINNKIRIENAEKSFPYVFYVLFLCVFFLVLLLIFLSVLRSVISDLIHEMNVYVHVRVCFCVVWSFRLIGFGRETFVLFTIWLKPILRSLFIACCFHLTTRYSNVIDGLFFTVRIFVVFCFFMNLMRDKIDRRPASSLNDRYRHCVTAQKKGLHALFRFFCCACKNFI